MEQRLLWAELRVPRVKFYGLLSLQRPTRPISASRGGARLGLAPGSAWGRFCSSARFAEPAGSSWHCARHNLTPTWGYETGSRL